MNAKKHQLVLGEENKPEVIISPTRTIVILCLDVVAVKYVHDIPKSICNRKHAK